jgi:nicotinate-nucleotide adenylyltransferase
VSRVAVYGGSFDPPHVGHVLAVSYVLSVGLVERVVVVPVFQHAFEKALTSYDDRLALCRAAFRAIPEASVSEIERGLPSYTLRTVSALKEERPQDDLFLLLGADTFAETPKWHRFEELAALAPPIVLGRVGSAEVGAPPPVLPGISSTEVRDWLSRSGESGMAELISMAVPAAVQEEIEARQLYRIP